VGANLELVRYLSNRSISTQRTNSNKQYISDA
jgi:hypothetical protein